MHHTSLNTAYNNIPASIKSTGVDRIIVDKINQLHSLSGNNIQITLVSDNPKDFKKGLGSGITLANSFDFIRAIGHHATLNRKDICTALELLEEDSIGYDPKNKATFTNTKFWQTIKELLLSECIICRQKFILCRHH